MSERMPEWMPERCQLECQNRCEIECQKKRHNICHKVFKECQNKCQIECQKECQRICQKVCQHRCQIERQNNYANYAIYTSRWYVRNYVKIVVQGGDHSKESNWTSNNQKDGNQNNWQWACLYNCDVYVWRIKTRNLLRIIVMYIRFFFLKLLNLALIPARAHNILSKMFLDMIGFGTPTCSPLSRISNSTRKTLVQDGIHSWWGPIMAVFFY